jgi:large subunit ribosomal protein L13
LVDRDPTAPLREAVRGMLQHNNLGDRQLRRLKIYPGSEHPHAAQQPVAIKFGDHAEVVKL